MLSHAVSTHIYALLSCPKRVDIPERYERDAGPRCRQQVGNIYVFPIKMVSLFVEQELTLRVNFRIEIIPLLDRALHRAHLPYKEMCCLIAPSILLTFASSSTFPYKAGEHLSLWQVLTFSYVRCSPLLRAMIAQQTNHTHASPAMYTVASLTMYPVAANGLQRKIYRLVTPNPNPDLALTQSHSSFSCKQ